MKLHLHERIVIFLFLLLNSTYLTAQPPSIICPGATITLDDTGANDASFWNGGGWLDPVVNSANLAERTTLLEFSGTDHCSDTGNLVFRYIISFDLNRDNVFETFVDSDSLPGRDSIYFGNSLTHLSSGTVRQFDQRPVPAAQKWGFGLTVTPNGGGRKARVVWQNDSGNTVDPEIPYGTHKIKWIVTDSCGVSSTCEYGFSVRDAVKPTVVCLNSLSVNILNVGGGLVQLWASDFLQYTEDNYTPANQLVIAIRRTGTGIGFPYDSVGSPQASVQFNCNDLGTQLVELWSRDKDGNTDFCETYMLIQDNLGVCSGGGMAGGTITTPTTQEGIANVTLEIQGMSSGIPVVNIVGTTDETGNYSLPYIPSLPISSSAVVAPVLDLDPLNGVNTFDLILISRHILGLEPLNTPYKLISADANKSGTLTTFDVVELRKLILGTYTELPNNNSWRFVDKTQNFNNPQNPFAETIRETINISIAQANGESMDFIGCKIGDVDETATPNFQGETEERNNDLKVLHLPNRHVQTGETVTLHFETPEDVSGLQMTLATKGLRLEKVIPANNCSKDNFGLFNNIGDEKALPAFTAAFENGAAGFDVVFVGVQDGLLHDMLEINSDITKSMAFDAAGRRYDIALRFAEEKETSDQPVFFQNNPNPWSNETRLAFYLPEAGAATITVTGQNGQKVLQQNGRFSEGYHQVRFEENQFPASGIYYVRLQSGSFSEVRKMMFYKNN